MSDTYKEDVPGWATEYDQCPSVWTKYDDGHWGSPPCGTVCLMLGRELKVKVLGYRKDKVWIELESGESEIVYDPSFIPIDEDKWKEINVEEMVSCVSCHTSVDDDDLFYISKNLYDSGYRKVKAFHGDRPKFPY